MSTEQPGQATPVQTQSMRAYLNEEIHGIAIRYSNDLLKEGLDLLEVLGKLTQPNTTDEERKRLLDQVKEGVTHLSRHGQTGILTLESRVKRIINGFIV